MGPPGLPGQAGRQVRKLLTNHYLLFHSPGAWNI